VGAKVAGRVVEVSVDLGDQVRRDDPLVTLDREEFRLAVAQAEAQLAQARAAVGLKADDDVAALDPLNAPPVREAKAVWDESRQRLDRLRQLRAENAVSSADVEQAEAAERVAEARYASAQNGVREKIALIGVQTAELGLARQRLADAVVLAPFDAAVRSRQVAPGTYVQVGQPLVELVRTSTLRFRGAIPERYAQAMRIGQQVSLRIETIDEPRVVSVTRISPALDEFSRSLVFEAEVDNPGAQLRSGLFAEAEVVLDPEARALVIPASAIVRFAGVEKVWKLTDGTCGETVVQLGRQTEDQVEIISGLAAGDVILVEGSEGRVARVTPIVAKEAKGA
jgi:RND family efflux transporter MFP subunit